MARKHISDRTFLAACLLDRGEIPYEDAKLMTEDQLISLYQRDHNILHETGHPDRDKFWNITPRLIAQHRAKSKRDAAIIAKGRRIRTRWAQQVAPMGFCNDGEPPIDDRPKRKLRSRGFDKTRTRKFSGKVVRRAV